MNKYKKVSIVLCTYNGKKYIKEQLDSVLQQIYQPYEIIIQDDGSTDGTMNILYEYAAKYPSIKVSTNKGPRGVNSNFFSAINSTQGDFIAICDQDDIWMPDKISSQIEAICGEEKMMCICRSIPFSNETGKDMSYDIRKPNCNLIRLLYASMPGHCMLFRRDLLKHIPSQEELEEDIYKWTLYDVILGMTAAALDSIVFLDKFLVRQRRHEKAASFITQDKHRQRSLLNGIYIISWAIANYSKTKSYMTDRFKPRLDFLRCIKSDTPIYKDGLKLLEYETQRGFFPLLKLTSMYIKYRHVMFYTYEHDPVAIVRALLFPLMQVYNYRQLIKKA